jgi:hypothetical protein
MEGFERIGAIGQMQVMRLRRAQRQYRDLIIVFPNIMQRDFFQ